MAKAFDSVSIEVLKATLTRIRMHQSIIALLTDIFKSHNMSIIIAFGNSKEFKPRVGIDQGDIISLLIWRIFYDPLLCMINERKNIGYKLTSKHEIDVKKNSAKDLKLNISAL